MKATGWKVVSVGKDNVVLKHQTGTSTTLTKLTQAELSNKDILRSKIKDALKRAEDSVLVNASNKLALSVMNFKTSWWRKLLNFFR